MYGDARGELRQQLREHDLTVALFRVADKYQMAGLLAECVHAFRDITDKNDLPRLLLVAEQHSQPALREVCV